MNYEYACYDSYFGRRDAVSFRRPVAAKGRVGPGVCLCGKREKKKSGVKKDLIIAAMPNQPANGESNPESPRGAQAPRLDCFSGSPSASASWTAAHGMAWHGMENVPISREERKK